MREYRVGITGHVEETRATPRLVSEDEGQREVARAAMARAAMHPYVSRFRLPAARVEGDRLIVQDVHYDHVTHDHEPAWIVFPLAGGGDDAAETASAHQLVLGVQPLAWGAVVLVAWGASRRR
ncbi:MAG: hypothetical protein R3326_08125, partial [Gemmatimonadota bacterium]|nr:hypothetical protein [Gemmatimonadota bacterium]